MDFVCFKRNLHGIADEDALRSFRASFYRELTNTPENLPELTAVSWKSWTSGQKQAYAEASLWKWILADSKPHNGNDPSEFLSYHPFGDTHTPAMEQLRKFPCVISIFPVCSEKSARICHLYLFENRERLHIPDHRELLVGNHIIDKKYLVYITMNFSPLEEVLEGKSWQLAYHMAHQAVRSSQLRHRRNLVQYMMTGEVRNEKIYPVVIGEKQKLLDQFPGNFLIPESNSQDMPRNLDRLKVVADTGNAWRIITGSGFEKNPITLPEKIKELHILVGESVKPVLSVILLLNPEKVFLWHSETTLAHAMAVQNVLSEKKELHMAFELQQMHSHDLQESFSHLESLVRDFHRKENIVICNTGGNRLMGIAALLAAKTHLIKVVYRDLDAGDRDLLTCIEFKDNQNFSADIEINRCPIREMISWQWLYSREPASLDDLSEHLFCSANNY